MKMLNSITCFILFPIFFKGIIAQEKEMPVTQSCLECILAVISRQAPVENCSDEDPCGPYRITKPYWIDAEQPTVGGESPKNGTAFTNCAQDVTCSYLSVQGYMRRYQKDCNGDKKINCDDFIKIHIQGGNGCVNQPLDTNSAQLYVQCKKKFLPK